MEDISHFSEKGTITMTPNIDDNVVIHIRDLYNEDEGARSFFEWAAGRQNDAAETTVDRICQKAGMDRGSAIQLVKTLSELDCGEFVVGRKGGKTRIRWHVSLSSLGQAAKGDLQKVAQVDPDLTEDVVDQQVVTTAPVVENSSETPLTITEAKRRLAEAFGVSPGAIEITIKA